MLRSFFDGEQSVVTPEQRVRELCSQLLTAQADAEIQALLVELKAAIHQHCEDLKALAAVSFPKADAAGSKRAHAAASGARRGQKTLLPDAGE
jgi:hypothetical protein